MTRTPPDEYVAALMKKGFAIGDWVGGGAFGNVYRADQISLNRPVAIKFYDNRYTKGEVNRKRMDREAPLLARLQHPSIPYVITTGAVKARDLDVSYMVMEYVAGLPLDKRLASGRPLDSAAMYRVMRDILSALDCAHQRQVVHRDVKPSNIVLSEHGTYLIDFSIGICLNYAPGLTRATEVGQGVGTTDYAAPEQLEDATSVDGRADVYSAGVVLAEMLGARPRLRLDRLDVDLGAVPAPIRAVIRRAVADKPGERFQQVAEFIAALDRVVGPSDVNVLEPRLVICPEPGCAAGKWSNGNGEYFWGPKVSGPTTDQFCESCGSEYLRGCPRCQRPLPSNIAALVVKQAKSERDALVAHCTRCSQLIYRTPTCGKCKSYLKAADMTRDTAVEGCLKCARSMALGAAYGGGDYGGVAASAKKDDDEDIPF